MRPKTIDRGRAKRLSLAAQGAAIVMLAVIGWLVLFGGAGGGATSQRDVQRVSLERFVEERAANADDGSLRGAETVDREDEPLGVDYEGIVARLSLIGNAPRPPAAPTEVEPDPVVSEPTPDEIVDSREQIRYLGMITEAQRRVAIVSVNGAQRVVPEGSTFSLGDRGEARLVGISGDSLTISVDGRRERVARAGRQAGQPIASRSTPRAARIEVASTVEAQSSEDDRGRRGGAAGRRGGNWGDREQAFVDRFNRQREYLEQQVQRGEISAEDAARRMEGMRQGMQRLREARAAQQRGGGRGEPD